MRARYRGDGVTHTPRRLETQTDYKERRQTEQRQKLGVTEGRGEDIKESRRQPKTVRWREGCSTNWCGLVKYTGGL